MRKKVTGKVLKFSAFGKWTRGWQDKGGPEHDPARKTQEQDLSAEIGRISSSGGAMIWEGPVYGRMRGGARHWWGRKKSERLSRVREVPFVE